MPTKREIQAQIEKLNKDMETAEDDNPDDFVEVYRVRKSAVPWLFQSDDAPEGEPATEDDGKSDEGDDVDKAPKEDPKPKPRSRYFGGSQ